MSDPFILQNSCLCFNFERFENYDRQVTGACTRFGQGRFYHIMCFVKKYFHVFFLILVPDWGFNPVRPYF